MSALREKGRKGKGMQTHKLKTLARYFEAVERGEKTFEVRLNDRAFQTGDILILEKMDNEGRHYETIPGKRFTTISIRKRISYILQGGQFGIESRYCVLGLVDCVKEADHADDQ